MTVSLVGAGPGDPELITVKGLARVRACDVIVYDRLVAPELVAEAPPEALRIERDGLDQQNVNLLLVAHGRRGHEVVRLKGGDPFLFGRGGEEALALAGAGVPFEVIPGVSSLASVPGAAGIPITHRGLASAVTAFAAHDVEALDAQALARTPGTLVAFMGLAGLERLAERLVEHGLPADTPAAVVSSGTTPHEQVVAATLGEIAAASRGLPTPALVVVGEVVSLRAALQRAGQRGAPSSREIPRAASITELATSGSRLRRSTA
jgi:uroporphyrin-III C-methyltransferase